MNILELKFQRGLKDTFPKFSAKQPTVKIDETLGFSLIYTVQLTDSVFQLSDSVCLFHQRD